MSEPGAPGDGPAVRFEDRLLPFDPGAPILAVQARPESRGLSVIALLQDGRVLRRSAGRDGSSDGMAVVAKGVGRVDLDEPVDIKIHGPHVALTNVRGPHGVVRRTDAPAFAMALERGSDLVEQCTFPVAFTERGGRTLLVHGTDWNRLDITDLSSGKCLTERVVDADLDVNYMDYCHSSLAMSPAGHRFVTNGWHWMPVDRRYIWGVEDFLHGYEGAHTQLHGPPTDGYLWDRPLCFVGERTVAWAYNPAEDEEASGWTKGDAHPCSQLVFNDALDGTEKRRLDFPHISTGTDAYATVSGELHFEPTGGRFVTFASDMDLTLAARDGTKLGVHGVRPDAFACGAPAAMTIEGDGVRLTWI